MTASKGKAQNSGTTGWLAASLFLLQLYPFLGMLWHHQYPLFAIEVLLVVMASAILALLLAVLMRQLSPLIQGLVFATLLLFVFTVKFNLLMVGMLSVFVVSFALALLLRNTFARFLAPVLLVLVVAAFLDSVMQPGTALNPVAVSETETGRGPLIHVLVDGFMAPDGLSGAGEVAGDLGERTTDFFRVNDFELHSRSYSHYDRTLDSMTRMFNFTSDARNLFMRNQALREPMSISQNRWFRLVGDMGYSLSVYQTEAMDFCTTRMTTGVRCNQFPNPHLASVHQGVENPLQRVRVLLEVLVSQSSLLNSLAHENQLFGSWGVSVFNPGMLDALLEDLRRSPGGAYFAHLIVPHAPFVLDGACGLDYGSRQVLRWPVQGGLIGNSEQSRAERYQRIVPQYDCAMAQLNKLFQGLKEQGIYEDATIIVHGDHGTGAYFHSPSRLNLERISGLDLREAYSALFAVKYPGGSFRLNAETESLNSLLAKTALRLTGFDAEALGIEAQGQELPFVYLIDEEPLFRVNVDIYSDL